VPGGGLFGISGVESGKAAPLTGGPPGVELHTTVDELPSGDTGAVVPVALPTIVVGMVPSGLDDIIAVDGIIVVDGIAIAGGVAALLPGMNVETGFGPVDDVSAGLAAVEGGAAATMDDDTGTVEPGKSVMNDVAGCADSIRNDAVVLPVAAVDVEADAVDVVDVVEIDGAVPVVPPIADMETTGTVGVPGAICPVGAAQATTVPGAEGSDASGTGASVVSGAPGCSVAENGLGPLSGDVTIVPGVDESPMAVVPMVETCATQAVQPISRTAAVNSKRRMATTLPYRSSSSAACARRPCCPPPGRSSD
jgi:hypothetical protein